MSAHLTEEYILAQRSQGARPESHSQGAAARQPALLISDCSELRRPDALHPGAPRAIVPDQMLFPKQISAQEVRVAFLTPGSVCAADPCMHICGGALPGHRKHKLGTGDVLSLGLSAVPAVALLG